MRKWWIVAAGLNGLAAVAAGAAAQHLWVDDGARALADTAVRYGLPHAAALLALGVTMFAGALYGIAAGAPPMAAYVVPVGGSLMILGWGLVLAYGVSLGRDASAEKPARQ